MIIATLIAADRLSQEMVLAAGAALEAAALPARGQWLDEGSAFDFLFHGAAAAARPQEIRCVLEAAGAGADVVVQDDRYRRRRLLVADMDSTMITVECIDELADYAGLKVQVAAVTEAAMRGELDFEAALDARVALLAGLDESIIELCLEERVRLTPGGRTLVRTMRAQGGTCLLVSGGFTRFAEPVAAEIGFDRAIANVLEVADGKLTGQVRRPIIGAQAKQAALRAEVARLRLATEAVLAVGDGANDIPMLRSAGLGIAYQAKPATASAAAARIDHNDLTALLWAQGYKRAEWITG